jgi:hypothetical protein
LRSIISSVPTAEVPRKNRNTSARSLSGEGDSWRGTHLHARKCRD